MSDASIILSGVNSVSVTIGTDAYTARQNAIDDARMVKVVRDAFGQEQGVSALKSIKALTGSIEKARKEVKAPVLDLGRRIDSIAAEFVAELEAEAKRIQGLLTGYEIEQRRIAAEAQAKREAEERARREAEERAERERREAEARAQREADEAARKAREAGDAEARRAAAEARAKAEAEQARIHLERVAAQAKADAERAAAMRSVPEVARVSGQVVRETWTFDLVDLAALAKARPDLVTITPKRAEILAHVRAGTREIPGLVIRQEVSVSAR